MRGKADRIREPARNADNCIMQQIYRIAHTAYDRYKTEAEALYQYAILEYGIIKNEYGERKA